MAADLNALTLGEILTHEGWGLKLRSGGRAVLDRRVSGVHSTEVADPSPWLAPDWVLLTTGLSLRGSQKRQRRLVAELSESGVAALGFGLGPSFQEVPRALLAEARSRSFPVFSVSPATPFREIVSTAGMSLLSSELRSCRRLLAAQRFLVDALQEPHPEEALLERVARLLDATVLLVDGDPPPADCGPESLRRAVRRAVADSRGSGGGSFEHEGWHLVTVPRPPTPDHRAGWLVAAARRPALAAATTRPILLAACSPLAALARLGRVERDQRRAVGAAVLEELLTGEDPGLALARALALGQRDGGPVHVAIFAPAKPGAGIGGETAAGLIDSLEREADPTAASLLSLRADALVGLLPGAPDRSRRLLEELGRRHPDLLIGVGREVASLAESGRSARDAEQAIRHLRRAPGVAGGPTVTGFEDLDLGGALLSAAESRSVQPQVDRILAPLRANPLLHQAVACYFANEMDAARAADALCLHPNSLRYRLRRVESLLGRSLRDPALIADLYLALESAGGVDAARGLSAR
jgi:purine catabolism regulator